ncbi:hypothetical protein LVJ94_04695 [Pendulispora rubella]|uniref:Uncharacterized protein n=1 Tax=Pendulispora rubella TaxID=2741070 RepID=A0ABZ2L6Z1_9BACT
MSDLNVRGARVVLRQRQFIDVVDLAVRFVALHGKPYAWLSLMVVLPSFLVTWAIGQGVDWAWAWVAVLGLLPLAGAPFTVLASRLMFTEQVRLREVLLVTLHSLPRLVLARILQTLAVGAALVVLVLPAIWAQALLLFLPEVILLEQSAFFSAVTRAGRIAHAQVGNVALAVILLALFVGGTPFLADAAGRMVLDNLLEVRPPDPLTVAGGSALSLFGLWAALPFVTTIRFLFYIDLRTRTEGWDIQTRFAAIAARSHQQEQGVSV